MDRIKRRRKNVSLKKFGINVNQYQLMQEEQNGTCYICDQKEERDLAVDHCHSTGRVRGLLCSNCNTGIGLLQDNTVLLQKAIEYLNRDYTAPIANNFDEYIEHTKRPRWRVRVITPDKVFTTIAEAAIYYEVHETTVHGWLGKLKSKPHLKIEGWEYEKVFTA